MSKYYSNVVHDPGTNYEVLMTDDKTILLSSIKNLSESNKILAESIAQAMEIQNILIKKMEHK